MKSVYSAVRAGALNKAICAMSLNGFIIQVYGDIGEVFGIQKNDNNKKFNFQAAGTR
jgi:hypothetical protein